MSGTSEENYVDLKNFTELELERELESRRAIKKPSAIAYHNHMFDRSMSLAYDYIDAVEAGTATKDRKVAIFEAVIEAVFGENVWDWVEEREGR